MKRLAIKSLARGGAVSLQPARLADTAAPAAAATVQVLKTEGIAPLQRPGVISRLFLAIVAFAERQNLK